MGAIPPEMFKAICLAGPSEWLTTAAMVEGSDGRLVEIVPNVLQRRALTAWMARYRAGKPARLVGLKPRKRGFSTISTACHYWMMRKHGIKLGLLGHQDNASTQTLFRMLEVYRDNDRMSRLWGNVVSKKATTSMEFSNGALLTRLTAENAAKVRSTTLQAISATEWAYWANSEAVLQAALNALGKGVFSSFIGESTPNGIIGSFPTTWKNARWPNEEECPDGSLYWKQWESFLPNIPTDTGIPEEELFIRIFAAWFEFGDSYLRLDDGAQRAIRDSIDKEEWYYGEQELIDRYGRKREDGTLVLGKEPIPANVWEQLAWRRKTIRVDCDNDRRSFLEEHPSDPHNCFISSGHPYFDPDSITTLEMYLQHSPPPDTGVLDWKDINAPREVAWRSVKGDAALFHVWEHPIEDCAYLVVIDSATGEANVKDGDPDRHSILVYRRPYRSADMHVHRMKLVARVRPPCLVPLHTAADWAARLAAYYQALLVPEINNTGQAIVVALRQFPHVHIARRSSMEDPRTGRRQNKVLVGHMTDASTRQAILDYLHKCLREELIDIACPHAIFELRIFAHDPNEGRPEAPEGEHDDDVLATAIALHWMDHATVYRAPTRARRDIHRDHPRAIRRDRIEGGGAMRS